MGQHPYAVGVKTGRGLTFRPPSEAELATVAAAEGGLARKLPAWLAEDIVPDEEIPRPNKTAEPLRDRMRRWRDLFSPRQLLALGTVVETLRELAHEIAATLLPDQARAVQTYLAIAVDKVADYNSRMIRWHSS